MAAEKISSADLDAHIFENMVFGRWRVIERVNSINDKIYYKCVCECGKEKVISKNNLTSGKSRSCGCLQKEMLRALRLKTNDYIISQDKSFVIGKATNTGNEFYIDIDDYEKIKDLSWYETKNGYMAHKDTGKKVILLHRLITDAPDGLVVDHINHNRTDNRRNNLRICTIKENSQNRKDEPRGICKIKRKTREYYMVQLHGKYLGCFKDYSQAKALRDSIMEAEKNGKSYL